MVVLLQNLTSFVLNGENQVNNEAGSLNDVAESFMDLIDGKGNEYSQNGLDNHVFCDRLPWASQAGKDKDDSRLLQLGTIIYPINA